MKSHINPTFLKFLTVIFISILVVIACMAFSEKNPQDGKNRSFESVKLADKQPENDKSFTQKAIEGQLAFQNDAANAMAGKSIEENDTLQNESLSTLPGDDVFSEFSFASENYDTDPYYELDVPEGCEITTDYEFETQLFDFINHERERIGVEPLTWNDDLANAARKHALDMACNDYFSHTNLDGQTFDERIAAEGYVFSAAGENLYAGEDQFNDPHQAYYGWYNSTVHYKVMIHPELTEVGIGYVYSEDSHYGGYFTADFGTPQE